MVTYFDINNEPFVVPLFLFIDIDRRLSPFKITQKVDLKISLILLELLLLTFLHNLFYKILYCTFLLVPRILTSITTLNYENKEIKKLIIK